MYVGHAAMGVALAGAARECNRKTVALLVGASLIADIGWCVLTMAGIEGGHSLGSQAVHAPRLPWSHSLASTIVLAVVFAMIAAAVADRDHRPRLALLSFAAVFLHWLLGDVPFGEGFPLTPWSAPIATPHLYARWPIAFVLEALVVVGCIGAAARMLGRRRAVMLAAALLGLHVAAWVPTFTAAPAIDLQAEPMRIVAYLVLLLLAWGVCIAARPPPNPLPPGGGAGR